MGPTGNSEHYFLTLSFLHSEAEKDVETDCNSNSFSSDGIALPYLKSLLVQVERLKRLDKCYRPEE
jgi:hypothetical protein